MSTETNGTDDDGTDAVDGADETTEPEETDAVDGGTESEEAGETDDTNQSFLGALSIIGAISFCCIGLGTVVGTAAVAGGLGGTTVAIGGATPRGSVISALVTASTVVAIALVARWYYR